MISPRVFRRVQAVLAERTCIPDSSRVGTGRRRERQFADCDEEAAPRTESKALAPNSERPQHSPAADSSHAERRTRESESLLGWWELSTSKFHQWKDRYGKANEHNGQVPQSEWQNALTPSLTHDPLNSSCR
jgi:hypothetical protein